MTAARSDAVNVIVLGAGRVGAAMARDLASSSRFETTVVDVSGEALDRLQDVPRMETARADLSDASVLRTLVEGHDLVVSAVPGPMGFRTVWTVLEAGRNVVDISFFDEDPFELDGLAREKGCTAVVDCGVVPGFSNILVGRYEQELDPLRSVRCLCGGVPTVRYWPYEYRATFSPIDVIAEYTRPARLRRGGRDLTLPALSEVEPAEFEGVGTLEAFNTDGLRTLLRTVDCEDMVDKTVRYPGHADKMRLLRETGYFSEEPVRIGDDEVRPIDLTAELLFEEWQFREGEEDLTVMRVELEGGSEGREVCHTWSLVDRYDREQGISSMARATGYTCTAAVHLLADGRYPTPGMSPPEFLGRDADCFEFIVGYLRERGVDWRHDVVDA
ncbi:MAG: saccharopine dehydrogenase C-terminal domain-containing protein [Candidatus Palauibacterales bacterium]|nr:saccharopine dehydrogenase C-terminal domain-containing protein [Candidatus Palauibacterales bacterium]MDP2584716.1 saccharopine dehydrogenase C-terminal domain-containing protein [Candidatus Palauibacterales bacterium]